MIEGVCMVGVGESELGKVVDVYLRFVCVCVYDLLVIFVDVYFVISFFKFEILE